VPFSQVGILPRKLESATGPRATAATGFLEVSVDFESHADAAPNAYRQALMDRMFVDKDGEWRGFKEPRKGRQAKKRNGKKKKKKKLT